MRKRGAGCLLVLCSLWSCHDSPGGGRTQVRPRGDAPADVVSSVDGNPITASEVARLASAGGLTPQAALQRLQAERLLANEAERRGYARQSETQHVERQALVQAMLAHDIEAAQVTQAEIDAAYLAEHKRFEKPELRTATHVLAQLAPRASAEQDQAAQAFCRDAIRRLGASADLHDTLEALRAERPAAFAVRVEQLPASPASGAFVPEFSAALFSLKSPGVVPEPVRTEFGWHAIVVTEITPASTTPRAEADATLRAELATRKRSQLLNGLLDGLRQRTRVAHTPGGQQLLAAIEY